MISRTGSLESPLFHLRTCFASFCCLRRRKWFWVWLFLPSRVQSDHQNSHWPIDSQYEGNYKSKKQPDFTFYRLRFHHLFSWWHIMYERRWKAKYPLIKTHPQNGAYHLKLGSSQPFWGRYKQVTRQINFFFSYFQHISYLNLLPSRTYLLNTEHTASHHNTVTFAQPANRLHRHPENA